MSSSPSSPLPLSYSDGAKLPYNAPAWAISASKRLAERRQRELKEGHVTSSIIPPPGVSRVLLHSCCAPCSGAMIKEMMSSSALDEVVVFFYNPNIHPRKEYEIRKEENMRFCDKLGIEFVDADYDPENWHTLTKGMELDPERGRRCTACFDMRMVRTAQYAIEHGFHAIATTNATSRWKDANQVDASGYRAVEKYGDQLQYWCQDWQTDEMTLQKYEISANNRFYKQEYCGCSHSLRDSNEWRKANSIPKIRIGGDTAGLGERYFSDPITDALEESQDVVDEFFKVANEIAAVSTTTDGSAGGCDDEVVKKRKAALRAYGERRKNEKDDGIINGLNNW